MRVLVVDDDPDIAEAVTAVVSVSWPDAEIIEAADGRAAIEHVRNRQPDIIVLDVGLPDMSGFDVMRTIRESSEVPIVMLTARDGHMDKVEGLEFGADDYITKPFAPMELLARLSAVLSESPIYRNRSCSRKKGCGSISPPTKSLTGMGRFRSRPWSTSCWPSSSRATPKLSRTKNCCEASGDRPMWVRVTT